MLLFSFLFGLSLVPALCVFAIFVLVTFSVAIVDETDGFNWVAMVCVLGLCAYIGFDNVSFHSLSTFPWGGVFSTLAGYIMLGFVYFPLQFRITQGKLARKVNDAFQKYALIFQQEKEKALKSASKISVDRENAIRQAEQEYSFVANTFLNSGQGSLYGRAQGRFTYMTANEDGTALVPNLDKGKLVQWMMSWVFYWPFYAINLLVEDFLKEFFHWLVERIGGKLIAWTRSIFAAAFQSTFK